MRSSSWVPWTVNFIIFLGVASKPTERRIDSPEPLPENAPWQAIKFQPILDFDKDSCYAAAAVDHNGRVAKGLEASMDLTEGCRDEADIDNINVYSRTRCNNGWCLTSYDHYFKRDATGGYVEGHKHDWENVVVGWKKGDMKPTFVAASRHGQYETRPWKDISKQGTHAKIVYHRDGALTHALRFAKPDGTDEPPENHKHKWIRSPLVDYYGFPSPMIRQNMYDAWPSIVSPKNMNKNFADILDKARGPIAPEFDVDTDE